MITWILKHTLETAHPIIRHDEADDLRYGRDYMILMYCAASHDPTEETGRSSKKTYKSNSENNKEKSH